MLTNYITDTDLKSYYPKIGNYLWKDETSYATQISEAFDLVLDELRNKDVDVRTLQIPLDLNRAAGSTADQNIVTSLTKTSTYSSNHVNALQGFRRFVIDVSALTTTGGCTYSVTHQGSNDIDVDDNTEPVNWTTIGTKTISATGVTTVLNQVEFKYYRYTITLAGATASITYKSYLVETYVDRWVVWKALQIIFEDFIREDNDVWTRRAEQAERRYNAAIENARYLIDSDDDNIPDEDDTEQAGNPIRLMR